MVISIAHVHNTERKKTTNIETCDMNEKKGKRHIVNFDVLLSLKYQLFPPHQDIFCKSERNS